MRAPGNRRVRFGPFAVDLHTHEVRKDGTRIRLIGQPFDILSVLLSRPAELVTREELRMRLWPGDTYVDFDHGLNAAVNKLRDALCDSADSPRFIETLPRRGYRFIAAVEWLDEPAGPPAPPARPPTAVAPADLGAPATLLASDRKEAPLPPKRMSSWKSPAAWGVALVLVLVGWSIKAKNKSLLGARADTGSPIARMRTFTGADEDAAEPSFSPDAKRIAFARWGLRPEDSGIFVKAVDSDRQIQLTSNQRDQNPVWSPDGKTIAFTRWRDPGFALFTVPAAGGAAQKVDTPGATSKRRELDWSSDGKWLAFSGGDALVLLSVRDGSLRRLTNPSPSAEDRAPAFSADSKRVLFVRSRGGGIPEEIRVVAAAGDQEELVTAVTADILGTPRWSADGESVVFSSNFGGKAGLWRASFTSREPPVQISDSAADPAIARQGAMLAYERGSHGLNIWQLDLADGKSERTILLPMTGQTDQGPAPQLSPDGQKLAFMSDRTGTMEIWVADQDGKNAKQLTAVGNAGTPRWSPDGKSVVFDANRKNASSIYTIAPEGGEARLLTADDYENRCPSWSRDGKWIYFASRRTGRFEVWKSPANGGAPVQITREGGHAALESPDGKSVFYAKTALAYPEIWQAGVDGGGEKLLSRDVRPAMWATWAVVDQGARGGILFAQPSGNGAPVVTRFDLATRRLTNVGRLGIVPFWLGASRDGKRVVFDQPGWQQSQIMLVENFR
ncbi:MAG TPA: winged helix-turn-helix domain-containing protein [Candidatus Acidoferrum sp.]|nr:winged helix-turn-helix domain-containing protein [Candidatus Acidoferrum sp.]